MANLSYTPPEPQDTDSELVIGHKTAVNISKMADAIGTSTDAAGAATLIGLLKQIVINTTPP